MKTVTLPRSCVNRWRRNSQVVDREGGTTRSRFRYKVEDDSYPRPMHGPNRIWSLTMQSRMSQITGR